MKAVSKIAILEDYTPVKCICERPKTKVLCVKCGFRIPNARIRRACPEHPDKFYVHDFYICPNQVCRATGYLRESRLSSINLQQVE